MFRRGESGGVNSVVIAVPRMQHSAASKARLPASSTRYGGVVRC
jgi:hypothetical protein